MAINYVQPGDQIAYINATSADISSGSAVAIGSRLGVALVDIPDGGSGTVAVRGVFILPKLSTDAVAQGDLLYWDDTNGHLTKTAGSLKLAGYAAQAAAASTTTVPLALNA